MIKKFKHIKKIVVMSAVGIFMAASVTTMALGSVTCSTSTSFLKKSATAEAYECASVGCIIYDKNGKSLASGENGIYNTNSYRTKSVSYTGLTSAYRAWAYAIDTNSTMDSVYSYY